MRLLIDSHVLIWAVDQPTRLSSRAAAELQDASNELLVSAATIWEIAIKVGLGKLALSQPYGQCINQAIGDLCAVVLPITVDYAAAQAALPRHHGDPFDRLLAAQSLVDSLPLVSGDSVFDDYAISRVW